MIFKSIIGNLFAKFSPTLFFQIAYFHNRKRFLNLSSPRDISEILIKQVVDGSVNNIYYLADKYKVRQFITSKGYDNLLTPLIGIYKSPEEIDFSSLPQQFAMKMNFGAGMNIICKNKDILDKKDTIEKLKKWLNIGTYSNAERHYNLIERRIIVEEFIDDGNGGFPTDYKFMCIHGKVFCILACHERETGKTSYIPLDTKWNYLKDYDRHHRASHFVPKPKNLLEMIKIAEDLSKGFGVIRVDLFTNGNKIWFGEMTLTPSGCILHGWTQKAIDEMGKFYYSFNDSEN